MFYSLVNKVLQSTLRKYVEELFEVNEKPLQAQERILWTLCSKHVKPPLVEHMVLKTSRIIKTLFQGFLFTSTGIQSPTSKECAKVKKISYGQEGGVVCKSSGTSSGVSKYIPVPKESLEGSHMNGGRIELALYLNHNPESKLFEGLGLRLGGSTSLDSHGKSQAGDLSAILIQNMPMWAEFRSAPSNETALMSNWEEKIDAILDEVISQNITSFWGVSSWFLVLFNKVIERTGANNLLEVWPNLELFAHGGVNFAPYESQFRALMPGDQVTFMENYNASEGFFAVQDDPNIDGLMLLTCCGTYYEFIPMDQFQGKDSKTITLGEVELGKE